MKLRIFSICLCLILSLSLFSVNASDIGFTDITIDYDRTTGTVSISGKAPFTENKSEPVRLMVLKPGTDIDKLVSGEETFMSCGIHADEVILTEYDFSFASFVIPSTFAAGDYIVRIATDGVVYTGSIPVATVEQATALINNASSTDVEKYIEMYNDVYGLDTDEQSIYGSFDSEGTAYVASKLANKTYADLNEFKNEFNAYTAIYKVKEGPWGTLENIVIPNASLLGLDLDAYNALSDSEQDSVFKTLVGNLYSSDTEFKDAFDSAVADEGDSSGSSGGKGSGNKGSGSKGSASTVSWSGSSAGASAQTPSEPFDDLSEHSWAADSIIKLYSKGIINGKADRIFAPEDFLTRAEAVKILVLAFCGVDNGAVCDFSDTDSSSWMYPYVATAYEQGIIKGYENGSAGVNDNITREDFCVMILRAADNAGITLSASLNEIIFGDSEEISSYAAEAVKTLQMAGVVNGMGENMFLPKANTTRAQAAKIVAGLVY